MEFSTGDSYFASSADSIPHVVVNANGCLTLRTKIMKKFKYPGSPRAIYGAGLVIALIAVGCASIPAPTEQIAVSKAAVSSASSAGGNEYAPIPLKAAIQKMNSAELAMGQEDYLQARQFAEQAQVDAQLSAATARTAKAQKAALELQVSNRVLREEIDRKGQ
jgi:hypothetical protein